MLAPGDRVSGLALGFSGCFSGNGESKDKNMNNEMDDAIRLWESRVWGTR